MTIGISGLSYPGAPNNFSEIRVGFTEPIIDQTWDLSQFSIPALSGGVQPKIEAIRSGEVVTVPERALIWGRFNDFSGQTFTLDYVKWNTPQNPFSTQGTPSIVAPGVSDWGAGALNLPGPHTSATVHGLLYKPLNILGNIVDYGAIRFRVKFPFSAPPTYDQVLMILTEDGSGNNLIKISYTTTQQISVTINNGNGSTAITGSWPWNYTTGGWHDIELNLYPNSTRLFIDGTQISLMTASWDRSGTLNSMEIGGASGQEFGLDGLQIWDLNLHSANFVPPDEEVPDLAGIWELFVDIGTLTGESGSNSYRFDITNFYIGTLQSGGDETLQSPRNVQAFEGFVLPFIVEKLEPIAPNILRLHFNRRVLIVDELLDPTRYTISGSVSVLSVVVAGEGKIDLYTTVQEPGQNYNLTISP